MGFKIRNGENVALVRFTKRVLKFIKHRPIYVYDTIKSALKMARSAEKRFLK